MAILEKEVWVGLGGGNKKYFKELGYHVPTKKDKWGEFTTPHGTKIQVKVIDLPKKSGIKLTKICDECGKHVLNQSYQAIYNSRISTDGKDRCKDCGQIYSANSKKYNVRYESTLEYFAKQNNKDYLLKEFSDKNIRHPNNINHCTPDIFLWNCPKCNSEYEMSCDNRTAGGRNCPYCHGKRVNETNRLTTTNSNIIIEWDYIKNEGIVNPNYVTMYSNQKAWWKCSDCGHSWKTMICTRTNGSGCPDCNKSKGEKRIEEWLNEGDIKFEPQKEFEGLFGLGGRSLSYDFYILKLNTLIEYQGEFHDGTAKKQSEDNFKKQQIHDRRKREYAELHNIDLLEIWYWDFDNIENILKKYIAEKSLILTN